MIKTTILLIVLLFSAAAYADNDSHKKLAIQLVRIYEKDIDADYNVADEVDALIKKNPNLKAYRSSLIAFMNKYLSVNQLKGYLVYEFMKMFPEDKLKEIVKFLSSPAGQLWVEKSGQFDKTIASIVGRVLDRHDEELMKMIEKQ